MYLVTCYLALVTSQSASFRLFAFDRLEERPEVAFAEAPRAAAPLDDLEKQRRAREYAFGEQLQQITVVAFVAVHQDAEFLQLLLVFLDFAHAPVELGIVISLGHIEEILPHPPHLRDGGDDV